MKKSISFILGIITVLTFVSSALAETTSASISKTLTSTTQYYNALAATGDDSPSIDKLATKANWNAPFYGASDSQRVVIRIYQKGVDVVSSTWVYSGYSSTTHPYKTTFQKKPMKVFLGAKVDDRDEGPITISGTFNSSK